MIGVLKIKRVWCRLLRGKDSDEKMGGEGGGDISRQKKEEGKKKKTVSFRFSDPVM